MIPDALDAARLALELAVFAALIVAARRAVDALALRLFREERWLWIALVAASAGMLVTAGLGAVGLLSTIPLALGAGLLALLSRLAPRRAETGDSLFAGASRTARLLAAASALVLSAPFLARGLFIVPDDWDGVTYHLLYAATWVREGRLTRLDWPYPHAYVAWYPPGGDVLHALAMSVVRSDLLVRLENLVWVPAAAIAVALLAARLGAGPRGRLAAALVVAATPALGSWAATTYVEPLLDAALLAMLGAVLAAKLDPRVAASRAALAGIAGGLACAVKYSALPAAAFAGAALALGAWRKRARGREALRPVGLFACGLAAVGAWPYVRNFVATGNPLFPVPFLGLASSGDPQFPWRGSSILAHLGDAAARAAAWTAHVPPLSDPRAAMGLGAPALVAAAWGAVALGARAVSGGAGDSRREERAAALFAGLAAAALALAYLAQPYWDNPGWLRLNVRFAVPAVAILVAAACASADRRVRSGALFALLAGAALAVDARALLLGIPPAVRADLPWLLLPLAAGLAAALARRRAGALALRLTRAAVALALFALLLVAWRVRERHRFEQWASASEPYGSGHIYFAAAARFVDGNLPPQEALAYATDGPFDFAYLFCGRRLERPVVYVPFNAEPASALFHPQGDFRARPDRAAWRANLERSGARVLLVTNWGSPEEKFPIERQWATELGFRELYRDARIVLFALPPSTS